jgi:SecD/SecF fusion protein
MTSIDETIWMALDGSITTIIPVIFLLIMGSSAIATFNVAMFIGLDCRYLLIHLHCSFRLGMDPNASHTEGKAKKAKKQEKEKLDEYTIKGINA